MEYIGRGDAMIKNRLKAIRHQLEIDTQTEFAELFNVARPQLNRWERQKEQPSLDTAIKMWKLLRERMPGLNLQDLFEDLD